MSKLLRDIEIIVCKGSEFGTWSTIYVTIPADTPTKLIEKRAMKAAYKELSEQEIEQVAHVAIFSIPPKSESVYTICKVCLGYIGGPAGDSDIETAHLHQGKYICERCWDERLKVTE